MRPSLVVPFVALVLFATSGSADPQSFGDAAKKEQERREKLKQAGSSTRTVTEQELVATKGTLANDPNPKTDGDRDSGGDKKADAMPEVLEEGRRAGAIPGWLR